MILKTSRLCLEIVIILLVAVVAFVGISAWRLSNGPLSLDFITDDIAAALSQQDQSAVVELETTVLTWAPERRALEIHAVGLRAKDADGKTLAFAPDVKIDFSTHALLRGKIAPTRLLIVEPRVQLVRAEDGQLLAGLGEARPDREVTTEGDFGEGSLPALLGGLLSPPDQDQPLGYLEEVRISDAQMVIHDRHLRLSWFAPRADITLSRDVVGLKGEARLDIAVNGHIAQITAAGIYSNQDSALTLAVGFEGVQPSILAGGSETLSVLAPLDLALDGTVRLTVERDGILGDVEVDLNGGRGRVVLDDDVMPDLQVADIVGSLSVSGDLRDVRADDMRVVLEDGLTVSANVVSKTDDAGTDVQAILGVSSLAMESIGRYWPKGAAESAREWIIQNISAGEISELQINLGLRADRAAPTGASDDGPSPWPGEIEVTSLDGGLLYQGLSVTYLDPLPPVVGIDGAGTFDIKGFDLSIAQGTHEGLQVRKSRVYIGGLDQPDQRADVDVTLAGDLQKAMRLLDHERLGYASKLGIDPADVGGSTVVAMKFGIPLLSGLTFDQVDMNVSAELQQASWSKGPLGKELSEADLDLELDSEHMVVTGSTRFGTVPLDVEWTEHFADKVKVRRRITGKGEPDSADVAGFGLDISDYVGGVLPLTFDYVAKDGGASSIAFDVDLKEAIMVSPELTWRKAIGVPGEARFTLVLEKGELVHIRKIDLESAGLSLAGSLDFAPGTVTFERADVTRLRVDRNDIAGTVMREPSGAYDIRVAGRSFDISDLIEPGEGRSEFDFPPMRISANIARLYTRPERYVDDAALRVHFNGEDWREIRFRGALTHRTGQQDPGAFTAELLPAGSKRNLVIEAQDAGAVAWTLGLSDNVVGGQLKVTGSIDDTKPDQPLDAVITANDYKLVKAPLTARLLTLASFEGIGDVLGGDGIQFSLFDVPLTKTGDTVTIKDGRMLGSELGFTLNGTLNLAENDADLGGTIVPAYTLNSVLGNIPVLGELLVGEKGSGIFAVSYRILGSLDDPEVSVNPLTALTPGFLRRVFGGPGSVPVDGVTQQEAESPATKNGIAR